ncbi:MAG: GTP-binding protein [Bacteroidia bacterium]|nr:GTP-binding protein [Bacteroidia bacterium]
MKESGFQCAKCGNATCELDEIRTTGGIWSKFFNIQNKRYTSVTCTQCKYTEFYKGTQSTLGNIIDFFGN